MPPSIPILSARQINHITSKQEMHSSSMKQKQLFPLHRVSGLLESSSSIMSCMPGSLATENQQSTDSKQSQNTCSAQIQPGAPLALSPRHTKRTDRSVQDTNSPNLELIPAYPQNQYLLSDQFEQCHTTSSQPGEALQKGTKMMRFPSAHKAIGISGLCPRIWNNCPLIPLSIKRLCKSAGYVQLCHACKPASKLRKNKWTHRVG